ncbi:methyltransferase [Streptomyces sp. DSM 44917]|uniref:Methyltransferase n=1 Tax=Streptomyces boetiae TaxID=3075541 RepID=A0ABU2LAY7_9ACTN|nr:methyltransferase [Streptomyces sp. DSM 44917]MDT0308751.1 methyltransferase [Streptomyces sp. DSM 44917]
MTAQTTPGAHAPALPVDIEALCDVQTLVSGLELGLFALLSEGPADEETIRRRLGLDGRGLAHWLGLLVSNGLLEREADRYRNGPAAEAHLVPGGPSYLGDVLRLRLFPALLGLTESLRTGAPSDSREFMDAVHRLEILRQFANRMDSMTGPLAGQLLSAYEGWGRHRFVLDVGGCRGGVLAHVLAAHPGLRGGVFDLPTMAPLFAERMAGAGLADRAAFHAGDFFADPLPRADLVMIGHVLVDWSAEQRAFLVRKAFESLEPGGALLVYDRMLGHPAADAERVNLRVSLSMLVLTRGGGSYVPGELRAHATAAGFSSVAFRAFGDSDTLAVCRKEATRGPTGT